MLFLHKSGTPKCNILLYKYTIYYFISIFTKSQKIKPVTRSPYLLLLVVLIGTGPHKSSHAPFLLKIINFYVKVMWLKRTMNCKVKPWNFLLDSKSEWSTHTRRSIGISSSLYYRTAVIWQKYLISLSFPLRSNRLSLLKTEKKKKKWNIKKIWYYGIEIFFWRAWVYTGNIRLYNKQNKKPPYIKSNHV